MKKLLTVMVFGMLLGSMTGCRIGECWNQALCSHCRPQPQQQPVMVSQPCVVSDPCGSPCGSPCSGAPVVTPGPTAR